MTCLLLGDDFPDFKAETTEGSFSFHEFLGNCWGIIFSHPADFTAVCTTELARMVKVMPEFKKRNLKVFGLSLDTKENHLVWIKDINTFNGDGPKTTMPFPMIADPNRTIARLLGMVEADSKKSPGVPFTARHVFFIDPKKKLRLLLVYPPSCGRNFDEILRIADSLQITDKYGVSTEADWKVGDRVVVPANFPKDKAAEIFTKKVEIQEFPSGKQYLQFGELKK